MAAVFCLALLAAAPVAGRAQEASSFVGLWSVAREGKTWPEQADVRLTADGGTWTTYTTQKFNACAGRGVPVRIDQAPAQEMRLTRQFSEVLRGCKDCKAQQVRAADGSVTGQRSGDRALTLVRP